MNSYHSYLEGLRRHMAGLSPQAKMEACGKAIIYLPPYDSIKRSSDKSASVFVYDLINFNHHLFADPLPMVTLLDTFEVEPGYGSLTGDVELGPAVRQLEALRARQSAEHYGVAAEPEQLLADTSVFTCTGVTGAMFLALRGALAHERAAGGTRTRVVFNSPTFSLADAFSESYGLESCPVYGPAERAFLPSLQAIRAACNENTLACVLVYPSNPFQASWGAEDIADLRALIRHCQENRIFLIADTIFQDLRWGAPPIPEIYALAGEAPYLCKAFSPSKDRPFACGYRIGYLLAPRQLDRFIEMNSSLVYNALHTLSQAWLAVELVLRYASMKGRLRESDWAVLENSFVFGYNGLRADAPELHWRVTEAGLFDTYRTRVADFSRKVDESLATLWSWIDQSECLEVLPRPAYGNILMVRIGREFVSDEDQMFLDMLGETASTAMIGGCFGIKERDGIWFRVVYGGNSLESTIEALAALQRHLLGARTKCA